MNIEGKEAVEELMPSPVLSETETLTDAKEDCKTFINGSRSPPSHTNENSDIKHKTESSNLVISHSNGEIDDLPKDNNSNETIELKETHEFLSNNNHKSTDLLQEKNDIEPSVKDINKCDLMQNTLHFKERYVVNGVDSHQESDDEMTCQFVDDPAVDPISTEDNKDEETHIDKLLTKKNNSETRPGTFEIIAINREHSSYEDSSDCSDYDDGIKVEETVSITSNSDNSRDIDLITTDSKDVIIIDEDHVIIDSQNGKPKSPEIHEIDNSDNDDCVLTAVEKTSKTPKKRKAPKTISNTELRRSSRTIKRKKYSEIEKLQPVDSDDDIQEVILEDGEAQSWKMIGDSQSENKSKTPKLLKKIQKKDAGIVIINKPILSKNYSPGSKPSSAVLNQYVCDSMASRGVTITGMSSNNVGSKPKTTQSNPVVPILPTLSDDMFVVEAPSFIAPYVYEKPAPISLKEYLVKYSKEVEEEKAKEEQKAIEEKLAEKAKRQQERKEKQERGEEVELSDNELTQEEIEKKKADKVARKERRRIKKEEDDVSWDGSSSEESDDSASDEDSQSAAIDKAAVIDDLPTNIRPPPKSDSYFDLSLGKFFMDIGANLAQEYVQKDLLVQENRKLRRENRGGHDTRKTKASIAQLTKNLEYSLKLNAPFKYELTKCEHCSFKTESTLVMAQHLEVPHMRNNMYSCNFCTTQLQSPHTMLFHMDNAHGIKGRLEKAPAAHQCPNCPFEDQGKGKLARHQIACAKRFKPETNLAAPIEWEHPAKIPKLNQVRGPTPYQVAQFGRNHVDGVGPVNVLIPGTSITAVPYRPRVSAAPVPLPVPLQPSGSGVRPTAPGITINAGFQNVKKQANTSIVRSPVPRQATAQNINLQKGIVVCEICDGYIKNLEQLRNHMQWIHKIKIHPKMIYNRPPLNCQKCLFRFFTDQGLERHLLGAHGLVTSAIQEAANRGKDSGRCPTCGMAYQKKLLVHVSRDHGMVLKPAHLSYKCTVCTATFGMYRQFEEHVYSKHSVVTRKASDKKTVAAKPNAAAKQVNTKDITVKPQPAKKADVGKQT